MRLDQSQNLTRISLDNHKLHNPFNKKQSLLLISALIPAGGIGRVHTKKNHYYLLRRRTLIKFHDSDTFTVNTMQLPRLQKNKTERSLPMKDQPIESRHKINSTNYGLNRRPFNDHKSRAYNRFLLGKQSGLYVLIIQQL